MGKEGAETVMCPICRNYGLNNNDTLFLTLGLTDYTCPKCDNNFKHYWRAGSILIDEKGNSYTIERFIRAGG